MVTSFVDFRDGVGSEASFGFLRQLSIDSEDNILVADGNTIRRVSPRGEVTTITTFEISNVSFSSFFFDLSLGDTSKIRFNDLWNCTR